MKEEKLKIPTKEGLKRIRARIKKRTNKQPSDALVRIIDEVTQNNEKSTDFNIAARPKQSDRTI